MKPLKLLRPYGAIKIVIIIRAAYAAIVAIQSCNQYIDNDDDDNDDDKRLQVWLIVGRYHETTPGKFWCAFATLKHIIYHQPSNDDDVRPCGGRPNCSVVESNDS